MQSASDQVAQKFELFGVLVIQKCFILVRIKWCAGKAQVGHVFFKQVESY